MSLTINPVKSAKKTKEKKGQHVKGGDTVEWKIDDIGTEEWLRVKSKDPGVKFEAGGPTAKGKNSISAVINYPRGRLHREVGYWLFLETTAIVSTEFNDSDGDGLSLVIDSIGGMSPKPPGGEKPGKSDHGHRHHGGHQG